MLIDIFSEHIITALALYLILGEDVIFLGDPSIVVALDGAGVLYVHLWDKGLLDGNLTTYTALDVLLIHLNTLV